MKCLECYKGELEIGVTSLTYSREGSVIRVHVDGIPAEICPVCGEAYLSEAVAQQIFDIVDPLLQAGQIMRKMILPAPAVAIRFPPLTPAYLKNAVMGVRSNQFARAVPTRSASPNVTRPS